MGVECVDPVSDERLHRLANDQPNKVVGRIKASRVLACEEVRVDFQRCPIARELTLESRLSCQCVPDGTKDLVVVIPAWNKNLAKEGH